MELLAAGLEKSGAAFHADLFQRFEAIGGKAGAEDIDARHSLAGEPLQGGLGIGFEPAGAPEARLEGDEPLVGGEPKPLGHEPRRLVAFAVVGVAQFQRAPRHAVELRISLSGRPCCAQWVSSVCASASM